MYLMTFKRPLLGRRVAFLALLLLVLLALPGCTTTKYVRELPPVDLLAACPEVAERLVTNGDLAGTILEYRKALAQCNIDKGSLREWAKE
jgi:hypothetical protein